MIKNGLLTLILLSSLIKIVLNYDPAADGICSDHIWFYLPNNYLNTSKQPGKCLKIYVKYIDNVYSIMSDDPWDDLDFQVHYYDQIKDIYSCDRESEGTETCRFSNVSLKAEPSQIGKALSMNLHFYRGGESLVTVGFSYDPSVPYDPNVMKFEEYLQWLSG
jgi:hypothetical protein